MKKILSILMALVLMLSMLTLMAGCGNDEDELLGKWTYDGEQCFAFFEDGVGYFSDDGHRWSRFEYEISGDHMTVSQEGGELNFDFKINGDDFIMDFGESDGGVDSPSGKKYLYRCAEADGIIGSWAFVSSEDTLWNFSNNGDFATSDYIRERERGEYRFSYDELSIWIDNDEFHGDVEIVDDIMKVEVDAGTLYFVYMGRLDFIK